MKILLLKNTAEYVDVTSAPYNLQEIGLARAFNRQGHKCDVVYWGGKIKKKVSIEYDSGQYFTVYYLKALNFLKNGIYFGLVELSKQYDVVHSGGYDQLESWILAKQIPEKLVVYHGTYYSEFNVRYNKKCQVIDRFFRKRYMSRNICFDTKSNLSADFLRKRGITNVTSVGVGIDLEQLQAKKLISSDLSVQIDAYKKDGYQIITYVGRIEPRRNIEFLFKLFACIHDKREKTKLLIIGKGESEYKERCFSILSERNISNDVIYLEYLKQEFLPAIYSASDIFLLPTRYEIFGMVLLEAMYFNVPVVTTYNGGSDMLIENGISGIIIDNFELAQWSESVIGLLDDPVYAKKLCSKAHDMIESKFTWDALVPDFIEVFQKKLGVDKR